MTESALGAWSKFSCDISREAQDAFKKAFKGHVGVEYSPVAVASQVVAGINYSFFCNANGVWPGSTNQAAIVNIFQAPGKQPVIQDINVFNPWK